MLACGQKDGQVDSTIQGRLKAIALYELHRSGALKRLATLQILCQTHEYLVSALTALSVEDHA
jgi:hypothetical protein